MREKFNSKEADFLFKAILTLKSLDECSAFFEDLCTYNELQSMCQRIHVARLLKEGETQTVIKQKTGASSATISRVNRSFLYGKGAYNLAFCRIDNKDGDD